MFTGSGISAESGLRTFRAGDGIWGEFDPGKVCDYRTWRSNRAAVHAFYKSNSPSAFITGNLALPMR